MGTQSRRYLERSNHRLTGLVNLNVPRQESDEPPSRPTVETVAREAAVSRQTVSNVLNAPHLVRAETLARVRAAIDQLGYRPHRAARALRTRRSYLVAAPIHEPAGGEVLDSFLHALTAKAQDRGYRLMLFAANPDDRGEIAAYEELLTDEDLDAFVLTDTHIGDERTAWLAQRGAAFVTFGRPWGATAQHNWVDVDGAAGTSAATRCLLDRGHRRIGFIGWPAGSGVGDDRRAGWSRACRDAGSDARALDRAVEDGLANGRHAAASLLDLAEPVTAIVCASDSLALGAWTELTARGLQPGRDVAVIGFDDTPAARVTGLSSVAQPVAAIAEACLALLHEAIDGSQAGKPPRTVLLSPTLVLRDSTGGEDK